MVELEKIGCIIKCVVFDVFYEILFVLDVFIG